MYRIAEMLKIGLFIARQVFTLYLNTPKTPKHLPGDKIIGLLAS